MYKTNNHTMGGPQNSKKRTWQQSQQQSLDPKLIEAKELLRRAKSQSGVKGRLVFVHKETIQDAKRILITAAQQQKVELKLDEVKTEIKTDTPTWNLYFGDEIVASGEYPDQGTAFSALLVKAVEDLKRYCFTLMNKSSTDDPIPKEASLEKAKPTEERSKPNLSVAEKMMAKMGWTGGGLGVQEQGIKEAIELREQVDRRCLGSRNVSAKITSLLADFAKECSSKHLVFSKEYSKDERAHIHSIARRYNLHSKSYGKGEERYLVVRCRLDPWNIVEQVMEAGGETAEYKLIYPTDL